MTGAIPHLPDQLTSLNHTARLPDPPDSADESDPTDPLAGLGPGPQAHMAPSDKLLDHHNLKTQNEIYRIGTYLIQCTPICDLLCQRNYYK
jgi:hypothetical protein